jgi:hypothetical protein
MSNVTNHRGLNNSLAAMLAASSRLAGRVWRGLRKPILIAVGAVIIVMLLIVVLQSGLGVDSDITITDSHRPEIVGGE